LATRTLSRRALRDQNDAAEADTDDEASDEDETPAPKVKKTRARKVSAKAAGDKEPAKPRVRKKSVKVAQVMFARWAVCDNGAKRVAVFEYRDRAGADAKLSEIRSQKTGTFYLLLVKDPCDPPTAAGMPA
jgi:polyphosphate kinase 2 (PPK2 family)